MSHQPLGPGFFPLLGVLLSVPLGAAAGQGGPGCLRPLSFIGSRGLPGPQVGFSDAPAPFVIAGNGTLCRRFSPAELDGPTPQTMEDRTPTPGRAFLLSAVIPGMGQRTLGQDRWVAYVAAEVWAWAQYLERRGEGRRLQRAYRDLAWSVARRVSSGRRVDGSFEYYESMTQYQSSGAFDIDPDEPGVQPEPNPATFNGSLWELAREIYSVNDPENPPEEGSEPYADALRYYMSRAIPPTLAWNWSDNDLQKAEFADLIRDSDENLRRGTTMIGLILANHLLSAVDALVTGRLLQEEGMESHLGLTLLPGPLGQDAWALSVRIPTR